MSTLPYEIVDVFTDRPFAGNPLAVVFGGRRPGPRPDAGAGPGVPPLRDGVRAAADPARRHVPGPHLHPGRGAAVRRPSERRGRGHPDAPRALPGRAWSTRSAARACCRSRSGPTARATLTGGPPTVGPALDPAPLAGRGRTHRGRSGRPAAAAGRLRARVHLSGGTAGRGRPGRPPGDPERRRTCASSPGTRPAAGRTPGSSPGPGRGRGSGHRLGRARLRGVAGRDRTAARRRRIVLRGATRASNCIDRPLWSARSPRPAASAVRATVAGHVVPIARGEIAIPPFVG